MSLAWPWEAAPRETPPLVEPDGWLPAESPEGLTLRLLRGVDVRLAAAPDTEPAERRSHLELLLRDAGALPDDEGMEGVLGTVERFLGTELARRMAASPAQALHRALPFVLKLEGGAALEGEVDVLWESPEGEAVVVAFKSGARHPVGAAAYAHELAALELAARRMVREGVPVRVGVVFLGEARPEPEWLTGAKGLEEAAGRLAGAVRALARGEVRGDWPGRERATCQALHCGFSEHCHPAPRAC